MKKKKKHGGRKKKMTNHQASNVVFSRCSHIRPQQLWTDVAIPITASSGSGNPPRDALVLDLAYQFRSVIYGYNLPTEFKLPSDRQSRIHIHWEDFSVPRLDREDWHVLVESIKWYERPVHVMCMGGHGRTGTALCILGSLLGYIPDNEDPVLDVRARYCESAVESTAQLDYIEEITGRVVKAGVAPKSWGNEWKSTTGAVYEKSADGIWKPKPIVSATVGMCNARCQEPGCLHTCNRGLNHSSQHECVKCLTQWDDPVTAAAWCTDSWSSTLAGHKHLCKYVAGHTGWHDCTQCLASWGPPMDNLLDCQYDCRSCKLPPSVDVSCDCPCHPAALLEAEEGGEG